MVINTFKDHFDVLCTVKNKYTYYIGIVRCDSLYNAYGIRTVLK